MAKKTENVPRAERNDVPSYKEQNKRFMQQMMREKTGSFVNMQQSYNPPSIHPLEMAKAMRAADKAKTQIYQNKRNALGLPGYEKARDDAAKALEDHKKNRDKYRNPDDLANGDDGSKAFNAEKDRLQKILYGEAAKYDEAELASLSDSDRADIDTLAKQKGKSFWEKMSVWSDADALAALNNPEGSEVFQQAEARKRLNEKLDDDRIDQLAEYRSRQINEQEAKDFSEETRKQADEHPFWSNVGAVVAGPVATFGGTGDALYSAIKQKLDPNAKYYSADPNLPGFWAGQYQEDVRGKTSENILGEQPNAWNKAANLVYKTGTQFADMGVQMVASGGYAPVAAGLKATETYQRSYRDALQRSGDSDKATMYALTDAAVDYVTDKIQLDQLFGAKNPETVGQLVKNVLVQGGLNVGEGEIGLAASIVTDAVIMGQDSSYQQTVGDLIAGGMSKKDAEKQVMRNYANQALEVGISSFASGAAMSTAYQLPAFLRSRSAQAAQAAQPVSPQQPVQEEPKDPVAQAAEQIGQDLKGKQEPQEAQQPAKPQLTDEEVQARVEAAMTRTAEEAKQKQLQQQTYEDLKAARKEQKDLLRDIEKAEKKLKQTGKGSPARIEQMKAQLEQADSLVRQIENQLLYFESGDSGYKKTISEALEEQRQIFQDAKKQADQAYNDFWEGKITESQLKDAASKYKNAQGELYRLSKMSQEDYQKELAQVGLSADREGYTPARTSDEISQQSPVRETADSDTQPSPSYAGPQQPVQEEPKDPVAQAAEQIGQDLKGKQEPQEAQQPAKPQLTDEEVQARVEAAMTRTAEEAKQKQLQQQTYEDLKAARKEQKDLRRDIEKAEKKLRETGKGSTARIEQMKAQLEQVNDLVRQIESQKNLFDGNYERTVAQAVSEQEQIFQQAKQRAADALNAYERGEITENQRDAEVNAYNNAGAELRRLRGMSQEEYRAELAEVGLIGDRANPELETGRVQPAEPQQDAAEMQQNLENAAKMQQNLENAAKMQRPQAEPEVRRQPVQEAQAQIPQAETPTKSYDEQRKNYTNAVNRMNDAMAAYEKGEISKKQLDAVIRAYKKESKELDRIRSQPEAAPNTEQKNIYMDSVKRLKDALDAYDRGEITNEQRDAALDAYTKESAELDRMRQGNVQESQPEPEMQSPPQAEPAVQMPKAEGQPLTQDVEAQTWRAQPGSYEAGMEDVETKPPRPKRHKKAGPIPEMEEGNSVGPAEAGFTGKKTFNEIIGDDNVQRDRRDDVRPMDIPAKDINGRKVSEVAGDVYGSKFTPDEFASLMQEPAAKGDLSYVPISNDKTVDMATESIKRSGSWEQARIQWSKEVSKGKAGAEMTARGCLLLNKAARDGNKETYMDILIDLQQLGTNTAQGLQAFRILRNFTPQDKLEFTTAATRRLSAKLGKDITIDQTLITAYKMAGSDAERTKIIGDIQQNVANQIPSTLTEKFNAVRYINMLGNLKTNVRNVAGNVGNVAAYRIKDSVGATIEAIANKVTGGRAGRTKSLYVNPEQYKAAGKFFDDHADAIASGGKFNVTGSSENDFMQGIMDKRRIFKSDTLEGARKGTDWMLNNRYFGDEAFGRLAFSRSLAGFLKANGVTETDFSKVDKDLMDRGIAYAVKQAQEATFHDNNTITRALGKMKRSTGVVGEGVVPFVKTPANVLIRAEEFSPLGLINSTYASLKKAAGGTGLAGKDNALGKWAASGADISGTDIIDSWAKSITGTGIAFLGGVLGNAGLLIGGADEDEKKAEFDKMNGVQPYALRIGNGKTLTIDFLSPVCMPLFMGKEIFRLLSDADQNFTMQDWEKVMTSIADPMIRMSMLQGLNDTLSDIRYADNNLFQFLLNACVSYLTQGLSNTLLGQLERSFEKNRMTTYIDKDSNTPVWLQKRLGSLSQRIPGWDYQQREYRDAFGNTQESGGLLYNTLSPGYISQERDNAVTRELNTLRELTGEDVYPKMPEKTITYTDRNGNVVKDHNLSMEELDTIQRVQGKTAEKIVNQLVQDSTYKSLPPQQRAKAMQLAKEYASEKGRQAALPSYYNKETEWMTRATQDPSKVIAEKVAADALSDAVTETMNRYAKGWDTKVADKELENAYQTVGKLKGSAYDSVLDNMSQAGRDYVEARKANISPKVYMDTMRDLADLKPEEEGKTNPNQKQKLDTVATSQGMSEEQRAIVAKQVLSEAKGKDLDEAMERGYSVEDFSRLYRLHDDYTHGSGKKDRTVAKIIEEFDLIRKLGSKKAAYAEASALYDIFK